MKIYVPLMAVVLVIAMALSACGSTDGDTTGSASTSSGGTETSDKSGETPVVRVITVTPVTAGTWDPAQHAAYDAAAEEEGWELEVAEAIPYGEAQQVLTQWGEEGVDIVFSTDNGYEEYLLAAAKQFPDTAWVMMSALASTQELPNVAAYNFDFCEFGYLQGATAALVSDDHVYGNVGPIPIIPVTLSLAGQEAGAEAAVPGTKILHKNTGDFIDAQKAATVASGLVGEGADTLISLIQGGVAPQVAARAQSEGVNYVGSFLDESEFAPKATVSSTVVNFKDSYQDAVSSWMDGSFSPEIHTTGVKEGTLEQTPLTNGYEGQQAKLDEQVELLANDEVKWPAGECAKG